MFIMIRFERACSRLIGKWLFSQDYLSPDLLFLILIFCLILTCLILLKKKEDFSSPPESIISIFECLSAIFMAVLASGPSVVQAMDHPPLLGVNPVILFPGPQHPTPLWPLPPPRHFSKDFRGRSPRHQIPPGKKYSNRTCPTFYPCRKRIPWNTY